MTESSVTFRVDSVNMLAAPGTQFVLAPAGSSISPALRFIPQFAYLHLRTMNGGALTTAPGVRLGTNANHNNVAPVFIPPTSVVVGQIGSMPLTTPLIAPPIDTADLVMELTQSAVGPAVMTADILLTGIIVG